LSDIVRRKCYNVDMAEFLPVRKLIWDAWNLEHIAKHNVSQRAVEEVLAGEPMAIATYKGRLQMIGPDASDRILSVVIGPDREQAAGTFYCFSARPASRKERLHYRNVAEGRRDE
jgi:uncharacterized DUF497 family protein